MRVARDNAVNPVLGLALCTAAGTVFAWLRDVYQPLDAAVR
jgi:hypothetical protein